MEGNIQILKKEIMPFVAMWKDLEIIILSEVCQAEKTSTIWYQLYAESKKTDENEPSYKTETDLQT